MNILIITPWCDDLELESVKGTPENAYLVKALLNRGHRIYVICQGEYKGKERKGINMVNVDPYPVLSPGPLNYPLAPMLQSIYSKKLRKILQDVLDVFSPHAILNIGGYGHIEILKISKKKRIPYIVKLMGTIEFAKGPGSPIRIFQYYREFLCFRNKADFYFLVDDGSLPDKVALYHGIKGDKFLLLPNPRPSSELISEQKDRDIVSVGYFSRFDKLKGTDFFYKIANNILKNNKDVRFIIAGDGPYRNLILRLKEKYPERIKYLGFIPHKELLKYYGEIDIIVSTNRYANATLQVVEGMNFGVPPVVFDVLGTRRLIEDGKTGLLVRPWNVKEFVNKLNELIENKEKRVELGLKARDFVRKNIPTWEDRVDMEMSKMEELVDARG